MKNDTKGLLYYVAIVAVIALLVSLVIFNIKIWKAINEQGETVPLGNTGLPGQ